MYTFRAKLSGQGLTHCPSCVHSGRCGSPSHRTADGRRSSRDEQSRRIVGVGHRIEEQRDGLLSEKEEPSPINPSAPGSHFHCISSSVETLRVTCQASVPILDFQFEERRKFQVTTYIVNGDSKFMTWQLLLDSLEGCIQRLRIRSVSGNANCLAAGLVNFLNTFLIRLRLAS